MRFAPSPRLLAASAAVILVGLGAMGQTAAPPPTKLAVVDIVKIFGQLNEKQDADRDIETMKKTMTDEVDNKRKALEDIEKELRDGLLKVGSPEHRALQDKAMEKSMELQVSTELSKQKLFLELRLRTADIYRKMNEAITAYSQQNGIALVFVADELNISQARTQEQLQAMVTVRKVVYFHPQFDITRNIIEKMNSDYRIKPASKP